MVAIETAISILATLIASAALGISYREATLNAPRLRMRGAWAFMNSDVSGILYLTDRESKNLDAPIPYERVFVVLETINFGRQPTTIESVAVVLFEQKRLAIAPVNPAGAGSSLPVMLAPGELKKFFFRRSVSYPGHRELQ